jgi:hypothetical protein
MKETDYLKDPEIKCPLERMDCIHVLQSTGHCTVLANTNKPLCSIKGGDLLEQLINY